VFKHNVTYIDFNGTPHNEDLYFHFMVPELADFEFNLTFDDGKGGGSLSDYIKDGFGSGDGRKVHTVFKLLVANSYGRRSEDGSKFSKNAEWTEEFFNSPAWEQFFLWLTDTPDGKNGQTFFNGIFPEAMQAQVEEMRKKQETVSGTPAPEKPNLSTMSREELEALVKATGRLHHETIENSVL
jgi:hypothetical protein